MRKSEQIQENSIKRLLDQKQMSVIERYKDIKIVTYKDLIRGELRCCLQVFRGAKSNPIANYFYMSIEKREEAINRYKESADIRTKYKQERADRKKSFIPEFEVGDIFVSSWGYEQTNVYYYQVIKKSGKCTAHLKRIASQMVKDSEESHGMACKVLPVKDSFLNDEVIIKKVGEYGINFSSYESAHKFDGKPSYKSWYY